MRVGIRIPAFAPVPEVVAVVRDCEAAGFDAAGFLDSQMITRDVFVVLAAAATATRHIRLMPAVTNPLSRHITILASAIRSVADLAPGRTELWLGRGFSSVNLVGLPYATVSQLRAAVTDLRRLLAGEWDVCEGAHSRMYAGDGTHVPIILAATGPRALRLGGAVADGVLINVGSRMETLKRAAAIVADGARETGRDPATVRLIANLRTVIRADREEARAWASPLCAHQLSDPAWLDETGIDAAGLQTPNELDKLYPDYFHAEDWQRAIELSAFLPSDLRGRMCDALGLIGTPDDCLRGLLALQDAGFDEVYMQTVGTMNFPQAEIRAFRDVIGPALAARTAAPAPSKPATELSRPRQDEG
jgi:5,10-methylenetetrahydromethanopterin reductase